MNFNADTSNKNIMQYLKERFPIVSLSLFSLITALAINSSSETHNYIKVFCVALIYLLFLFHLRVLDEFKDYQYDNENHKDRPIQSGLISLSFIKKIGVINFVLLNFIALLISSPYVFLLCMVSLLYTGLMFKEFFIPDYLRKRPVFYLISHEIVLIPLYLFFYSVINGKLWFFSDFNKLSLFLYTFIPIILIEIGRKLKHRYSKEGKTTNDTYAFIWGERKSIQIFSILILIAGLLSIFIQNFNFIFSTLIIISSFIIFLGSYLYPKLIIDNNMLITSIFVLALPFLILV
jgi:4-hydroxybenzoate polyprenyltransferase